MASSTRVTHASANTKAAQPNPRPGRREAASATPAPTNISPVLNVAAGSEGTMLVRTPASSAQPSTIATPIAIATPPHTRTTGSKSLGGGAPAAIPEGIGSGGGILYIDGRWAELSGSRRSFSKSSATRTMRACSRLCAAE